MTGSCLLHNKLHYNGLMTDLGCMFQVKRRVVFFKTTCRFLQNNVSFSLKQRIVFYSLRGRGEEEKN